MTDYYGLSLEERKKLRQAYENMMARCYKNDPKAYIYKGKGIIVCQEWRTNRQAFTDWAISNGFRLDLSLDRKLNCEDYTPENCQ